jgi:hypothetical protein
MTFNEKIRFIYLSPEISLIEQYYYIKELSWPSVPKPGWRLKLEVGTLYREFIVRGDAPVIREREKVTDVRIELPEFTNIREVIIAMVHDRNWKQVKVAEYPIALDGVEDK